MERFINSTLVLTFYMFKLNVEKNLKNLLAQADIKINTDDPSRQWDIQVHKSEFYDRAIRGGTLAFGRSYMEGWWDCQDLTDFFTKVLEVRLEDKVSGIMALLNSYRAGGLNEEGKASVKMIYNAWLNNPQDNDGSLKVGTTHYDAGNDLFQAMLGESMTYTCGYWQKSEQGLWKAAETLEEAQDHKLDMICKKLDLEAEDTVLDIGCGFGSFAKYAAEKYGAKVVGITISQEQLDFAKEDCKDLDVEFVFHDYLKLSKPPALAGHLFDKIVSIGMFEHVGSKNYSNYFKFVDEHLKQGGISLIHTIGNDKETKMCEPWTATYVFPNSNLPTERQIRKTKPGHFFEQDFHEFGKGNYDPTIKIWHDNLMEAWSELSAGNKKYTEKFRRMFKYYLNGSEALFKSGQGHLYQFVYSKGELKPSYKIVR